MKRPDRVELVGIAAVGGMCVLQAWLLIQALGWVGGTALCLVACGLAWVLRDLPPPIGYHHE